MSVIVCSECGNTIDDECGSCPNCGAPVEIIAYIFCSECGNRIPSRSGTCQYCGAPVEAAGYQPVPVRQTLPLPPESSAVAVCALVFAFLFPPVGLVLGIIGLCKCHIRTNVVMSGAAIVVSVITAVLYTFALIYLIPRMVNLWESANDASDKYQKVKDWIPFID